MIVVFKVIALEKKFELRFRLRHGLAYSKLNFEIKQGKPKTFRVGEILKI